MTFSVSLKAYLRNTREMSSTISPPQTTKASSAAILLVVAPGWKEVILHTEPALRNFLHVLGLLLDSSHRLAHLGIVQLRKLEVALPLLRSLNL